VFTMSLPQSVPIPSTNMTEEEVKRLIEEFPAQGSLGADRRKHERIQCRKTAIHVLIDRLGGDTSFLVLVNNISSGGFAFKHSWELQPGTSCDVKIMLPRGGVAECEGNIVRCRELEGGGYQIGLQFAELLDISLVAPRE
jgi:hypothetical protein